MIKARIFRPIKTAMQSGKQNVNWVLEYLPQPNSQFLNQKMGWTSSKDMMQEVKLSFSNKESAIEFAKKNNIPYEVIENKSTSFIKKSYSNNFM
jgi:hypothetical protein